MTETLLKQQIGAGIIVPALSNKFRLEFINKKLTIEQKNALSRQVTKTNYDLLNKKIFINIEQSVEAAIFEAVHDLIKTINGSIALHIMGCDTPYCTITFNSVLCEQHDVVFSYSESTQVTHVITFSFDDLTPEQHTPKKEEV